MYPTVSPKCCLSGKSNVLIDQVRATCQIWLKIKFPQELSGIMEKRYILKGEKHTNRKILPNICYRNILRIKADNLVKKFLLQKAFSI